jgi:hypothetical protein
MKNNSNNLASKLVLPSYCLACAKYKKTTFIFLTLHLCYIFCFIIGLYGVKLYMNSKDKVVIQNVCGTTQRGYSTNLDCDIVFKETAIRSTLALLSYNGLTSFANEEKLNSILGKSAKKQFLEFLSTFEKKFQELKITQYPKINHIIIKKEPLKNQAVCYVNGIINRHGYYHGIPNTQTLEFSLGLRLAKTKGNTDYPYKVLKFIYQERNLYHDNPIKGN